MQRKAQSDRIAFLHTDTEDFGDTIFPGVSPQQHGQWLSSIEHVCLGLKKAIQSFRFTLHSGLRQKGRPSERPVTLAFGQGWYIARLQRFESRLF